MAGSGRTSANKAGTGKAGSGKASTGTGAPGTSRTTAGRSGPRTTAGGTAGATAGGAGAGSTRSGGRAGTASGRPAPPPGSPPGTRVTRSGKVKKPTRKQRRINKMRSRPPTRFLITYDINGPKVRLGMGWAVLIGIAALGQETGLAVLYGAMAALAGWQAARAWKTWGEHPEEYTSGAIAGGLGVASAFGFGWVGVVALGAIPLALLSGFSSDGTRSRYLGSVGLTLQCGLFLGVAAASPALTYRLDLGGFVALIVLVCVYEMGDFLIGSGSSNHVEGPLAGIAGIAVFTFAMAVIHLAPFKGYDIVVFGAAAAVLCPLGQLAGSAILPRADARAPALRRLDSLLVLGPAWTFGLYQYLTTRGR